MKGAPTAPHLPSLLTLLLPKGTKIFRIFEGCLEISQLIMNYYFEGSLEMTSMWCSHDLNCIVTHQLLLSEKFCLHFVNFCFLLTLEFICDFKE